MALRGRTLSVLLNPTVAGELDPFEKFVPAQLEMRNGIRTLGGAWKRRPGYAEWKGTQILNLNSPVVGLFDLDDHLLCVSENGTLIAIGDTSFSLGTYDKAVGRINVASRPMFAEFNGSAVITAGGTPKIMYRGKAYRLGLEIKAPTNSPTLLDWGTGDPFPGSRYDDSEPPPGGGIGGTKVIPAEAGGLNEAVPPPISGGGGGSGGGSPDGSPDDVNLAELPDIEVSGKGGYKGDNYRGGSVLERVAEGAGSIGPSAGQWVYGYSFLTVNGETQVGPPSDFVQILTPNEGVRVVIPGTEHPFVTARRLYRARFYEGVASVWRLVTEIPGRSRAEYFDQVSDSKLGETELPYNTAESLAPEGSRFVAVVGDHIVVAGADRYSFDYCPAGNWLSWPIENRRRVDADSGPITGLAVTSGALMVFCRDAIEVWSVQGGQGGFTQRQKLNVGLLAPHSLVTANGGHYFVSENRELYRLGGGLEPVSVGNRDWFQAIDTPGNIYAIHFPLERRIRFFSHQQDSTLVYDYAQNAFSYESSEDSRGERRMVGVISGAQFRNMMVVGSRTTGDLYEWSEDHATDNGTRIAVTRRLRVMLSQAGNRCRCQRIRLRLKREAVSKPNPIRPPFVTVSWALDGCGTNREDVFVVEDCDGSYADICAPGVGRELVLEVTENDTFDYMLTHAFVSVLDLGR